MAAAKRSAVLVLAAVLALGAPGCARQQTPPAAPPATVVDRVVLRVDTRTPDTYLESAPFRMWLPMRDGTLKAVETTNYEVFSGDVPLAYSFWGAFVAALAQVPGTLPLPVGLCLLGVEVDDSRAAGGRGRCWVMAFNDVLAGWDADQLDLFLEGLARTVLDGNPYRRPEANFTRMRVRAGATELEVRYELKPGGGM